MLVEGERLIGHQQQQRATYYIRSLKVETAKEYKEVIRGHWAIENGLHWLAKEESKMGMKRKKQLLIRNSRLKYS